MIPQSATSILNRTSDLLSRPERHPYGPEARKLFDLQPVLVTGAGGSIGREICRELHLLGAKVFMLDHDESALHGTQLVLSGHGQLDQPTTILADIRGRSRLIRIMREVAPIAVFHAAAHKHLAILERYPSEAILTNVMGTENVVLAAAASGARRMILVSTDKAATPTSVLGATKRLAETITQDGVCSHMATASVRFGNVLGSRGSFLHILAHQMDNGMPITITDREVERFFMTIPEAAGLVIEAAVLADQGETYVLDMGQPIRIVDLVKKVAKLLGRPEPRMMFTGLVQGEKLTEVLTDEKERLYQTPHPKIGRLPAMPSLYPLALSPLYEAAATGDEEGCRAELLQLGFKQLQTHVLR